MKFYEMSLQGNTQKPVTIAGAYREKGEVGLRMRRAQFFQIFTKI